MKFSDLKYKVTIGAMTAVACLPLGVLYGASDLASFLLRRVVKYRRRVVRGNLSRAFPEASEKELRGWEKRFYRQLCDTFIETLKLLHISDREVDRRVEVVGAELVDQAVEGGHSVVLFLGHYGNWEWVTAITRHFKSDAVMSQIYHPLSSEVMDRVMLKVRSRFGNESIPMKRTMRRLLEIEHQGGHFVTGFISDQRPVGKVLPNWMDFLGIDTPFIVGGEVIGDRVGARYLYVDVEPLKRGHYRLTFKEVVPLKSDLDEGIEFPYSRQYMRMLESTIRRDPSYWLWSHNRFFRTRQ